MSPAARRKPAARSGGPRHGVPWSPEGILPERNLPENPPGPPFDGERLHPENVPERRRDGLVPDGVENREHLCELLDRGREAPGETHRWQRRMGHGEPPPPHPP